MAPDRVARVEREMAVVRAEDQTAAAASARVDPRQWPKRRIWSNNDMSAFFARK